MVWKPTPAGPRNLREMFHWMYRELTAVGKIIGPTDGSTPGEGHVHTIAEVTGLEAALGDLVYSGYGGMRQSAAVALADIGAGWVTLVADEAEVDNPRNMIQNLTNNSLAPTAFGVWRISIVVNLDHDESVNATRVINVRALNLTTGLPIGSAIHVGVSRNVSTTNVSFGTLVEVDPAGTYVSAGDEIVIQVGGTTDTLTNVVENTFVYSANIVSEYVVP